MKRIPLFIIGVLLSALFGPFFASTVFASSFVLTRDTISDSAPSSTAVSHVIEFVTATTIPFGGTILITPEGNYGDSFTVPPLLDFTDLDVGVDPLGGSAFIDRSLDAMANGVSDGVAIVSGSSGSILVTLGDAASGAIPAGSRVKITIGTNAAYEYVGDQVIQNPGSIGSYRIRIFTKDAGGALLDSATTMIAIVAPISIGPIDNSDVVAPVRSGGLPMGELLGSTVAVQISLFTDKEATCRFDTIPGLDYQQMTATMTPAHFGRTHFYTITPLANNTAYNYYVRCQNVSRLSNNNDYPITFTVGAALLPGGNATNSGVTQDQVNAVLNAIRNSNGPIDAPEGASSFSGPGPAGGPFLGQGIVTIDGEAYPGAHAVYMKDGKIIAEENIDSTGHFNKIFTGLDRGTYVWGVYVRDPKGRYSSTFNSTIYLIGNSNNIIAPVYLSPSIYGTSTVGVGDSANIEGYAIPNKTIQVLINKKGDVLSSKIITSTTTATASGYYRMVLPTATLAKGTYEVKAKTIISEKDNSPLSPVFYLGVGESPKVDFALRADLNRDKKVNLVDFSILLFNWKTSDSVADINQDGVVNLTDFSIMLSNWTG